MTNSENVLIFEIEVDFSNKNVISSFVQVQQVMDLISNPPLSSFNYHEWKLKMIAYLKSNELFDVSIGVVSILESDDEKSIWFNNYDRSYGAMCLGIAPSMRYLIDVVEFPSEFWSRLDK